MRQWGVSATLRSSRGQGTVEAAVLIPVLMLMLLIVAQPAIILYDQMVMRGAASETCRLLMTKTDVGVGAFADEKVNAYVQRRLGSIPPIPAFHVHGASCSYLISTEGNENSEYVSVHIENRLKPLPLMQPLAMLFEEVDAEGNLVLSVDVKMQARPAWTSGTPEEWISRWE
jgi:hypothetical protein